MKTTMFEVNIVHTQSHEENQIIFKINIIHILSSVDSRLFVVLGDTYNSSDFTISTTALSETQARG